MKHVLRNAQEEITRLRRQNEILSAKVEMIDLFACVLHTKPAEHVQDMSVDVVWELGKEIEKIEADERARERAKPDAEAA